MNIITEYLPDEKFDCQYIRQIVIYYSFPNWNIVDKSLIYMKKIHLN